VAASELPRAGQRELGPQDKWRPRSCLGRAVGAGSAGHVAVPELAWATRFMLRLTTLRGVRFACLAFCLDLELVRGVPGLQGTDKFKQDYIKKQRSHLSLLHLIIET
jgi:hypothetical protein